MFTLITDRRAAEIERLLASVIHRLDHMENRIMSTLDDIKAEADAIRDGVTKLIAAVNDEAAKIADLTAQLAAAAADPAKIDAIASELGDTVTALNAATAAAVPPPAAPPDQPA